MIGPPGNLSGILRISFGSFRYRDFNLGMIIPVRVRYELEIVAILKSLTESP